MIDSRVLMTADAVGGVWTYALELARALVPHGFLTTLATMGPLPEREQLAAARAVPGLTVISRDFRLEWMDHPWDDVARAGEWLLELEARLAPAVVHVNGFAHAALPWRSPVVAIGHSCLLSWSDTIPGALEQGKVDLYRAAATRGLRSADRVVAPTAAMLAALQRHYGPFTNASVVSNGRTAEGFRPAAKEPLVFTAGRLWDRAKNVQLLASIAPRLEWPVVIAGTAHEQGAGTAPELPGARMVGRLTEHELSVWLGRASIFALPARYEPFGLLPLEAALSGCALVLGDIASLREVWGDTADYVDPASADALHAAIARLIAAPRLLRGRAAAARERALGYTPARMAGGYAGIYHSVLRRRREWRRLPCAS
jgi:glycosyltransferase involved in cell wall biosynthesis